MILRTLDSLVFLSIENLLAECFRFLQIHQDNLSSGKESRHHRQPFTQSALMNFPMLMLFLIGKLNVSGRSAAW